MPRTVRVEFAPAPPTALRFFTWLNVAIYALWQLFGSPEGGFMADHFLVSLEAVASGRVWTVLTSAVSHVGLAHLGFNLLALWVLGRDVEAVVGARGMVHLYVAGAAVSALGHLAYVAATGSDIPALGASGAVMAVAVVSALLFPRRMLLVFFFLPMPQLAAVSLFVLVDLVGLLHPGNDMIAHAAHLGGAAYGLYYARWHARDYLQARLDALGASIFRRQGRFDHPVR